MSGSSGGGCQNSSPAAPKILLAKPSVSPITGKFGRGNSDDENATHRSRLPPVSSLNMLSDSWDFHIDRFLPFLTENTDFTVVGVIGPPGVGKSTILNAIYVVDGNSPRMLPPFSVQSEEIKASAKHCIIGIELRVSAERFILLDTQPVFSPSILAELIRPDGSSSVPVLGSDSLLAEFAHEIMCIQLGVLLASICHVLLVVSEGVHEDSMWHLMSTVDLLKHAIPDPSSPTLSRLPISEIGPESEYKDKLAEGNDYMATPIFVHSKFVGVDFNTTSSSSVTNKPGNKQLMESELILHEGGCHCGKIKWRVKAPRNVVAWSCNCTDCSMRGNINFVVPSSNFHLLDDSQDFITTYTFGTHTAKHTFCKVCGITSFYTPRSNPDGVAVTVKCVKPGTLDHVEIRNYDGQNWETSHENTGIASFSKE